MTDEEKLRATAFHEAGHAVMAFDLGVTLIEVSITPDADSLGYVRHRNVRQYSYLEFAIAVAGPWAEYWVNEDTSLNWSDIQKADAMLESLRDCGHLPWDVAGFVSSAKALENVVDKRLLSLRPAIEQLAEELLRRKMMTGEEVEDFLEKLKDQPVGTFDNYSGASKSIIFAGV